MKIRELFEQETLPSSISDEEAQHIFNVTGGTIKKNRMGDLIAQSTLKIANNTYKDLLLQPNEIGNELKYKLSLVLGELRIEDCGLTSFKNFPEVVRGNVNVWGNRIRSFEGCPREIDGYLDINENPFSSFKDIHKHIDKVERIYIPHSVKSNILGVMKITHPPELLVMGPSRDSESQQVKDLRHACVIINRYIQKKSRDFISCQEELMDNGLGEYAKS